MIDFSKIKFRASSWGNLMSDPQSKADKEAGKLGLTAQKELLKIYRRVVYDWDEDDVTTPAMEKGTIVQPESISMYSAVEGKLFTENTDNLQSECFTGTPDLYLGDDIYHAEQVDDMKNSFLLSNFIDKTVEKVTPEQKCQLNVYFDLTGASGGNIVHALVSLPPEMFQKECQKLFFRMSNNGEIATEYAPEYIFEVERLKKKYLYDHIPPEERIFKQPVERDDELIKKMKDKVPVLRKWLEDYHNSRIN
jgi:hypothetical protein